MRHTSCASTDWNPNLLLLLVCTHNTHSKLIKFILDFPWTTLGTTKWQEPNKTNSKKKTTSFKIQTSISSLCKKYIQLWILHQVMRCTTSTAVCLSNAKISINTDGYSIFDVWKIYSKSHLFLNDWISNARLMSFSKRYHAGFIGNECIVSRSAT